MYTDLSFSVPAIAALISITVLFLYAIIKLSKKNLESAVQSSSVSDEDSGLTGVYDVFLSFCGEDTRLGFTDFLYTYLIGAGISTFRDDNDLRIGDHIGFHLIRAITESKISIPVLSKSYAHNKWCLAELSQMVECCNHGDHVIFPVFYDVDPSDVRNQTGSYEKAFGQHRRRFDNKTVQKWREALRTVGQLKGLELKKETGGREGELVKIVVEKVLLKLKKNYTHVPKNLVGMDNHEETLKGLLELDFSFVRIVGIHGMGGLGKTTIAKVIYNKLFRHFEHCCFLDDIRENSHHNGICYVQKQLISKIQNREVQNFHDVYEGSNRIKDAVRGKKVLIVLDDIDDKSQIDSLAGSYNWFGAQSRIIITTRNEGLLYACAQTCQKEGQYEVYKSYKPELINTVDSLKLFSRYAFMVDSPPEPYDILSEKIVSTASGLPLVLVTLGSSLFGENDIDLWDEKLRKLKDIPEKEVIEKLRLSFDPLDYGQKQLFLDIACFFVGNDTTNPSYMWDDCKFYPKSGLSILVRKSMITIEDDNTLRMHDQMRDLGRQIVCEENFDEFGKWSRLWCKDKILAMFKTLQGTKHVKAIGLNPAMFGLQEARTSLTGEYFRKLPNLRYLTMGDVNLDGDFENLLSNLRWLQWKACSLNFAPTNLHLPNLVILDLSYSYITNEWAAWNQIQISKNLKVFILSNSRLLSSIPKLSAFTTLERLHVDGCNLLDNLNGLEKLESLRYLNTTGCESLERFPNLSKLNKLEELNVLDCVKLIEIPRLHKLESLEVLNIGDCSSLKILPNISSLKKLKTLNVAGCKSLVEIQGLDKSGSLEYLYLNSCTLLKRLPNLSNLRRLKNLNASLCSDLIEIQGLDELDSLQCLDISHCDSLERLPVLSKLKRLKRLDISFCENLTEVHGLGRLESLEYFDMSCNYRIEQVSDDLSVLKNLKEVKAWSCEALIKINGLDGLMHLEDLDMFHCKSMERLPDLSNLNSLKKLNLSSCESLIEIQGLDKMESLEYLYMRNCGLIDRIPDLPNFGKLKEIDLSACYNLKSLQGLENAESLETLDFSFCDLLGETIIFPNLKKLRKLVICYLTNVYEISGFEEMKSLELLSISGCKSIQKLPEFSNLKNLIELHANECSKLIELKGLEKLESLRMLKIRGCVSLENLPYLPKATIEKDNDMFADNEEIMNLLSGDLTSFPTE